MDDLVIQHHDFENAKNEIKIFSEQTLMDLDIRRVKNKKDGVEVFGDLLLGRGFNLDHVVTGDELNDLTSQIQKNFYNINNTLIKLIKEFGQVYSALEALDRDYIQAIILSIKATEETSKGLQKTQEQIKKIVENQRRTLEELKKFKQKIDGYVHLDEIDQLWTYVEEQKRYLKEIDRIGTEQAERLEAALQDVYNISKRVSASEKDIQNLHENINKVNGIAHLEDVDNIWTTVKEHSGILTKLEKQNEVTAYSVKKNKEEINENIVEVVQATNAVIEELTKKVKYAYWIAGGALGLAVIVLILLLV
ncbi:hypothetical protein HO984_00520 [Streptococcus suis]|uniref:hypothetical protein n=1 Tax=Streptococcus suis TaxID=1307 RepID=UPI0006986316|nr:hypothetical protein [Streptococcus suis]NQH92594.1 hypothetical protein [Streptococcus suis]NQO08735.1 hypothetical protein [Streptococcus suis]NQS17609.1 hypothetical protein [Streptococcus suis]CYU72129.1 Uncharacterised protein [Streptococcus suis]HEM2797088.1 hypothetical protein [Streptococcus suis]